MSLLSTLLAAYFIGGIIAIVICAVMDLSHPDHTFGISEYVMMGLLWPAALLALIFEAIRNLGQFWRDR